MLSEIRESLSAKTVPFSGEQRSLEMWGAPKSADSAARSNHAVIRQARVRCGAKDVADRACGAGTSGQTCNVAIGRDPPQRNASDHAQHTTRKDGRVRQRITASISTRPSARGRLTRLK